MPTSQHGRCLELLQTSIRERRGLSVCYGVADSGKTMLFRELVQKFKNDGQFFLIPIAEPHCRTIRDFIGKISSGEFTIPNEKDPEKLKSFFKEELIQSCAVEKKAAILLIDNGQNLPDFALEYLGELYNHQLNAQQLLQIVILARPEFKGVLGKIHDLTDRLYCDCTLNPLRFGDVQHMVCASFQRAADDGGAIQPFDLSALAAIYFVSAGNPLLIRKVCRHALLSLVAGNRRQADFVHVLRSSVELALPREAMLRGKALLAAGLASLLLIGLPLLPGWQGPGYTIVARYLWSPGGQIGERQAPPATTPAPQTVVHETSQKAAPPPLPAVPAEEARKMPSLAENAVPPAVVPPAESKEKRPGENVDEKIERIAASPPAEDDAAARARLLASLPLATTGPDTGPGPKPEAAPPPAAGIKTEAPPSPPALPKGPGEESPLGQARAMPAMLGEITVFERETLGDMIRMVYGPYSFNRSNTEKVAAVNPQLGNRHMVRVGDRIKFPTMAVGLTPRADKVYWLHFVNTRKLQEAYRFLRIYMTESIRFLIIPSWDRHGTPQFSIFLQHYFESEAEAERHIASLAGGHFPKPVVMAGITHDRFYFAERPEAEEQGRLPASREKEGKATEKKAGKTAGGSNPEPSGHPGATPEPKSEPKPEPAPKAVPEPGPEAKPEPKSEPKPETKPDPEPKLGQKGEDRERNAAASKPGVLGTLGVPPGETLGGLIRQLYGPHTFTKRNVNAVCALNQQLRDPGNLPAGMLLTFPAIPVRIPPEALASWHVELLTAAELASVYPKFDKGAGAAAGVFLLASREAGAARPLHLFLASYYRDAEAAEKKAAEMRQNGYPEARVVQGLDKQAYVFVSEP